VKDFERTNRARALRNQPSEPEIRPWYRLSRSQLEGFKSRRQAPIGPFFADFLCPARALIVELDGETHDADEDARRDAVTQRLGFDTLRFTNSDVMTNIDGVLRVILDKLHRLPPRWPHPNPSPEGEGLS